MRANAEARYQDLAIRRNELLKQKLIFLSRDDRNAFRQYTIINDLTNNNIIQEPIHKRWMEHIEYCQSIKKHCAILAPWGHGKSVQIAISESCYLIAKNPNIRIKIICASDLYATDRVKSIKQYIESDRFKELFPNIEKGEEWGSHRLTVKRDVKSIDPTIEARGITSTGIGGRADVLIFDDPVDESSISSEAARKMVREKYQNLWLPRLISSGMIYYIATRWHDEDLTRTVIDSGAYSVMIHRISQDFKSIEEEII